MQPFDRYFRDKMKDADFKALYDDQCCVCANTVAIFEKMEAEKISMSALAEDVESDPEQLHRLRDADHCNPHLVIRLCRRLGLHVPESCSKLDRND